MNENLDILKILLNIVLKALDIFLILHFIRETESKPYNNIGKLTPAQVFEPASMIMS